jgi:ESS family glutamate:Na+ symporter
MTTATVGLGLIFLGLLLGVSALIRYNIRFLQNLHIPASIIGGFITLVLGPQGLGHVVGGDGIFPAGVLDFWTVLPGLLINVVFAALLLGKPLPSSRAIWNTSAPHVIGGMLASFGQLAIASLAVLTLLHPLFGLPPEAGALLEMSFSGGHGTVAGLEGQLKSYGVRELADLGLALATLSLAIAVILGTVLVNRVRHRINLDAPSDHRDLDIGRISQDHNDPPEPAHVSGLSALTSAVMFISFAIGIGIALLWALRWLEHRLTGSDFLEHLPLFPLALIGGVLLQLLARPLHYQQCLDRRMIADVGSIALDLLILSAIGTMSLAAIGKDIGSVLVLTVLGTAWSIIIFLYIGPRLFARDGLVHGSADFGQSLGNVATGFVLLDMADPNGVTEARLGYAYKQLAYEPFFGGGVVTALAVPLIAISGIAVFAAAMTVLTIAVACWGIWRIKAVAAGRTSAMPGPH